MPEIEKEVKQVLVEYFCDLCHTGKMKPTGVALLTYPAQYPHVCDNPECEERDRFGKTYPYLKTIEL